SSREHAALCPMYLGVRAVIAKSIERIHKANLINFAIVPIEFEDPDDYEKISEDDELEIENLIESVKAEEKVRIKNKTKAIEFTGRLILSERDRKILLSAGLLNYTREKGGL
ncbi:MAG: aconitate hydratase, partial [Halobacteriota archaeon]|nr:aconitate hydratase [Halobacteriota archaeon]